MSIEIRIGDIVKKQFKSVGDAQDFLSYLSDECEEEYLCNSIERFKNPKNRVVLSKKQLKELFSHD
jgi:hypothetical protein